MERKKTKIASYFYAMKYSSFNKNGDFFNIDT